MRTFLLRCLCALAAGCAHPPTTPTTPAAPGTPLSPAKPPEVTRVDPFSGNASASAKDPGFVALEQELQRAKQELGSRANPAPHFLAYEVYDQRRISISAQYGALVRSSDDRRRVLDVDVRVGDPKLDSTHVLRGGEDYDTYGGGIVSLPLEADADAIRAVAWSETDKQYKAAVERFLKVKTQQQVKAKEEDTSDDFSREPPVTFVEPAASLAIDVPAWEGRIRALSARFRASPELHDSQVSLEASAETRWLTNTEGSSVQTSALHVRVFMEANTRADDGMELRRYETFDAELSTGLPDEAAMAAKADAMIADLRALRKAPLAEPFAGPAILEGRAAGVFFHEIFGHRVEGHRQKREEEGQTFAKKVGTEVMPDFVSVYDDPTLKQLGGEDLNGFYRFDDEAVPAQRATLVDRGVMRGFLMGRSPTRGFDRSNGHGRRQPGYEVVARQGNLVVEPASVVAKASLGARLREEAKRQGKPYGLRFEDISGGFTLTGRSTPQAFKVMPILVYRVWADGRPDELIRGADIVGTPLAALGKILAAADDYQTFNGHCGAESGAVPVSASSPSLLIQQIEIERKEKGDEQPPLLSAPDSPPVTGAAPPDDAVVRRALDEELKRAMSQLRLPGEAAPYYLAYTVDDTEVAVANATFGAVTDRDHYRGRMLRTSVRVGDPKFDNGNTQVGPFGGGVGSATLSIEDDLASLRRDLWLRTDEAYKFAVQMLAMKKAAATSQVHDEADEVPDFAAQPAAETVTTATLPPPDPTALAELAKKVSAVLRDYPGIATSRVAAMHMASRRRLLTSEGTWADQRASLLRLEVAASTQADDGMELDDYVAFSATASAALPAFDRMQSAVRAMAERLQARRAAERPKNGTATVLFEGDAAAQLVKQLLGDQLVGTPPPRTMGRGGRGPSSELLGRIGQKVTAPLLSAVDDPTLETGPGGEVLLGGYRADDEGVPAQRVQVVEDGVLRGLLMSRTPSKDIPRSNGHARSGGFGEPRARVATLVVSAKGGLARAALLAKAGKLAKQKAEPLYVVRLLDDPGTLGTMAGDGSSMMRAFMFGRGGGAPPQRPLVAFRVEGGKEIPVRGFTLEGLMPQSLKDVVAASKEQVVLNYLDVFAGGPLPSSVVSPALLFTDLEVREQSAKDERRPLYPHPYFAASQAPAR